ALYDLPVRAIATKQKRWLGIFSRYPGAILGGALDLLEMYLELLKELRNLAEGPGRQFTSAGFRRFFAMVREELDDAYLTVVQDHLRQLRFRDGVMLGAQLGRGNEGANYILCQSNHRGSWVRRLLTGGSPVYSYTIPPRDDHGARALGELRDRGINEVANAVAQAAEHVDQFFAVLRQELAFYIGALNLAERLVALGEPIAFPQPLPPEERRHTARGLYDPCLALTMNRAVVGNDLNADGKDLVMITGPNQGGKSTFLRSIGLAQLMMQCGLFVPAESFTAHVCTGVFTHFKREEDPGMESGKLDEELARMSAIVDRLRPHALVLCNESFAATNEREGSEIGRQVIGALIEARVKVFFVTHQYELAHGFQARSLPQALFLRAERREDGARTFRLHEAPPLPTAFGRDLYRRVFETGEP
ncbi:MAG: DNA mismatch repair protein MutS, partial [Caldilineales bacterium]|nr:DNA mismatch repair protein MutS [Caldilineales bacterium]